MLVRTLSRAAFVLLVGIGVSAWAEVVEDDFDDAELDPTLWARSQTGDATVEETGGVLKISAPAAEPGATVEVKGVQLVGNLDTWVDYNWAGYDTSGDARAVLRVMSTEGVQGVWLNCHRWGSGGAREIILQRRLADGNFHNVAYTLGSGVPLSGKLRIRRAGATFSGYYWKADQWVLLGSVNSFTETGRVIIENNNISNNHPPGGFEVHWDNFHAQADQILRDLIQLPLDILPGDCPNEFTPNLKQTNARLPTAILGTADFDVSQIDVNTISINDDLFPVRTPKIEDVTTPVADGDQCACHLAEGDGIDDLVLHFSRRELILALRLDLMDSGTVVPITVKGLLIDGTPFEATDCITLAARE